jgi:hypothetical protein
MTIINSSDIKPHHHLPFTPFHLSHSISSTKNQNFEFFFKKLSCGLTMLLGLSGGGTPRRHPTTTGSVAFELLVFTPGPVRQSLANLESRDSSRRPILTPSLDGTPGQRDQPPPSGSPTQIIHTTQPPRRRITGVRHSPSYSTPYK